MTTRSEPLAECPSSGRDDARHRRASLGVSLALVALGCASVLMSMAAPDAVDLVAGRVKVAVGAQLHRIFEADTLPEISLGGEGGMRELDRCDGTFTEMISYRVDDVPPLFAAHNDCGGDIILGWDLGQRVRVAGSGVVYEVVEERHTPKWSDVDALVGMAGEFVVQTCYYGENRMRFLALVPVDPASDTGATPGSGETSQPPS